MTTATTIDYNGLKFFDAQMNIMEVLEYSERYKGYLLSENNDLHGKHRAIMQSEEIELYLTYQEKYIQSRKKFFRTRTPGTSKKGSGVIQL